jgi:predicted RNA-binding Zn ribbon-like protein
MTPTPHEFQSADLVAGHVVLDLLNTVTARDTTPHDWLATPASLLQWAGISGHFDSSHLARLQRLAGAQPAAARAALRRCRRLREALHSVFSALQQGRAVDAQALQTLERQRRDHAGALHPGGHGAGRGGAAHGRTVGPGLRGRRAAGRRAAAAGGATAGPAAHLRRHRLRLDVHRQFQGRSPPLVRHGHLRHQPQAGPPSAAQGRCKATAKGSA